jgi:hypothetical protein
MEAASVGLVAGQGMLPRRPSCDALLLAAAAVASTGSVGISMLGRLHACLPLYSKTQKSVTLYRSL